MSQADKDALKRAAVTATWVFVALFVSQVLGWMGDLIDWLTEDSVDFPETAALVTALAAAILSAFVFVGAALLAVANAHIRKAGVEHPPEVGSPE